jgi:hypothetical protein
VLARPRTDSLGLTPLRPWREALCDYIRYGRPGAAQQLPSHLTSNGVKETRTHAKAPSHRLDGPILLAPRVFGDERGFFCGDLPAVNVYAELGIGEEMVQDNHSRSQHGIVRGMHFQIGKLAPPSSCAGPWRDLRRAR